MPDPTPEGQSASPPRASRHRNTQALAIGAAVLVLLGGGAAGLYGIAARGGKATPHTGACAQSLDRAVAIDPLVHGQVAGLVPVTQAVDLGALAFDDGDGHKTTLATFKGRTVLLNLWATWCVPCRAEMPSLDKLQASRGSSTFTVVPVNVDTARLDKPRAFLKEIGATNLPFYADPSADILRSLKVAGPVSGLPTSVLVGKDGCAIAVMAGPAEWDSTDATTLIDKARS